MFEKSSSPNDHFEECFENIACICLNINKLIKVDN